VGATALADLEEILYGAEGVDPRLPSPDEVVDLFTGVTTEVRMTGVNAPAYNSGTHVVTLPAVTGVQWEMNGEDVAPGAKPALAVGETAEVRAKALEGYQIEGDEDWTFDY
jgi:hypothetical protein